MGEKASYVELVGRESDTNAAVRSRGFHDVLDKYPGLQMAARQSANWDQREAFQKMETLIQGNRAISGRDRRQRHDGARRDGRAQGRRARRRSSWSASTAAPTPLQSIKAGEIKATVLQPAALIARLAVDQAHQLITTGSTGQPEKQSIDCELVTPANADAFGIFARK